MYANKRRRPRTAQSRTKSVLLETLHAMEPGLDAEAELVSELAHPASPDASGWGATISISWPGRRSCTAWGKVGIPDTILDKPGPLTRSEWEFVRQHTLVGERLLSASSSLRPVAVLVRARHERWDGRGYPDGRAGDAIPLGSRIVAVCDAYGAMISERPYRAALSHAAACQELRAGAGTQFDPAVVEAFLCEVELAARSACATPSTTPPSMSGVCSGQCADFVARTRAQTDHSSGRLHASCEGLSGDSAPTPTSTTTRTASSCASASSTTRAKRSTRRWRQDVPARRPVPFRQPTQPADAVASPPTHPGTGTTNQWACSSWSEHCLGVPSQQSSTVLPGPRYCTAGRLGTT